MPTKVIKAPLNPIYESIKDEGQNANDHCKKQEKMKRSFDR